MDWETALRHLPLRFVVTDRKGRVLLCSHEVPGVAVGHSFLKLAHADEVVIVGRAAKRALTERQPARLSRVTGVDGSVHGIELHPFGGADPDHLILVLGPAGDAAFRPTPAPTTDRVASRSKTPDTAPQAASARSRGSLPPQTTLASAAPTSAPPATKRGKTPAPAPERASGPMPVAEATELVVVAAGGALPLARALETVLQERVKVRAMPVATFVEALVKRGGSAGPEAIDRALDSSTRVWFVGDSPFTDAVRIAAWKSDQTGNGGWAIGGGAVRCAATWVGEIPAPRATDVVADLQFEIMEVMRRAMPIRRQGRVTEIPVGLKRASAFLEQPAAIDVVGDNLTQARHHVLVVAIARLLQDGLDALLATDG